MAHRYATDASSHPLPCRPRRWLAVLIVFTLAATARADEGALHSQIPSGVTDPQRVIALEFLDTEIALALELPIVGVADKAAYRRWVEVGAEALTEAVDVGGRAEPSLEQIIRLQPDLIVGSTWRHAGVADRLARIAPLALYRDLPKPEASDQFTRMRAIVRDLGSRTGRAQRAESVLARIDAYLAQGREQLAEAGLEGTPVVFGQVVQGNDRIRLFTDNSMVVQVMQRLGLRNGWDAPPGEYGYRSGDIGALRTLSDGVHLVLSAAADSRSYRALTEHPAWAELAPVRAGNAHRVARELWPFGGPYSAMRIGNRLVERLTGSPINAAPPTVDGASTTR
ncbi:MAG: iron-siderophore ABC transporter substrate-binding protein [Halofilum sp. (in: g-proteobacteria)]